MSKVPAPIDRVRSGESSRVYSWLSPAARHGRLPRYVFGMAALWLTTCDSLWTQFREPNPINCLANPGICAEGQVCNSQTRLCAVPELRLVAGGLGGSGNADDFGADARFISPYCVALDAVGNLYVSDRDSYTIRRLELSTGMVSTIAGMAGMRGTAEGIGTAARFYRPSGLLVDGAGNLYVADSGNHTIRKIVLSTGLVTTLAGLAGTSGFDDGMGALARFNGPFGLTSDGTGNLYVADGGNHILRKIVASTGVVSTIAGKPGTDGSQDGAGETARFYQPLGVVFASPDTLYVADTFNHTLRKVVVGTGVVTTIAGASGMAGSTDGLGSEARFRTPLSVAADSAGHLFVVDTNNHTVRKVVLSTGTVTTIAGTAGSYGNADGIGPAARFNTPLGVAADEAGDLFVADTSNLAIRKVALNTGVVTTIAGKSPMVGSDDGSGTSARFSGPSGVATDGADNLYAADAGNSTIRRVVLSTGMVTSIAGTAGMKESIDAAGAAARFSFPTGLATDGTGNLFVTDYATHTIRKLVLSSGAVTTLGGAAGMIGDADSPAPPRFNRPYSVAADGAGNLYIADSDNHTIRKLVLSSGEVKTIAGTALMPGFVDDMGAAARFRYPTGVATDGAGNLYVADLSNHTIRKIVLSSGKVTTLAGTPGIKGSTDGTGASAQFNQPYGVATDGAGNLFVADTGNSTIRKITLANAVVTTIAGVAGQAGVKLGRLPGRLGFPTGVAVLPTGEIFIAEAGENAVLAIR